VIAALDEQLELELDQVEDAQSYEELVAERLAIFLEHPGGVGIPF